MQINLLTFIIGNAVKTKNVTKWITVKVIKLCNCSQ